MTENIDTVIAQKETEFSPHYTRMEQLKQDFIRETIFFSTKWYRIMAKEYVSKNAEHILTMGNEQLLRMKSKINILVAKTEKTVNDILNNRALWWHLRPTSHDALNQYLQLEGKYPIILDQAVRLILGNLGEILQEFHFRVATGRTYGSFEEFWYIETPNCAVVPYFPHLLAWSIEMQQIITEYNIHYLEAIGIYKQIELLKDQKKRELALSRWDSF
jgi:hypothetical protein